MLRREEGAAGEGALREGGRIENCTLLGVCQRCEECESGEEYGDSHCEVSATDLMCVEILSLVVDHDTARMRLLCAGDVIRIATIGIVVVERKLKRTLRDQPDQDLFR